MEILNNLTIILPLLIGYILGRNRDDNKTLFNKKLEIYSDIVYLINSHRHLCVDLHTSVKKIESLKEEIDNLEESKLAKTLPGSSLDEKLKKINKMMMDIEKKVSLLNYTDELTKLFAPARLIGSKKVVDELREYFSLVSEYFKSEKSKDLDHLGNKITTSAMELEQLMRKDLSYFRILSKSKISMHLKKIK